MIDQPQFDSQKENRSEESGQPKLSLCSGRTAALAVTLTHFCFITCHLMKPDAQDEKRKGDVLQL